ncbi:MAG: DUF362 domain-containing protein [Bryobacterales bacterium]|nr:DUF362 domain-containing protein [Bryobacterales bacterium]
MKLQRRQFLAATAMAAGHLPAALAPAAQAAKTRLGLVASTHSALRQPAPLDATLTLDQVRAMVFRAISLGSPNAGSLEEKIKPGAWVVIKPNIVALRPRPTYRLGDITDFRVTQAVLEYVAARSRAGRITIAEGGSYRRPNDPAEDNATIQDGRRVSAYDFDWGPDEFPGFHGSIQSMLTVLARRHPDKKFDYIDLSYDCVRDPAGRFRRIIVPKSANGTGAFGGRPDYFVTNTILNCDFLITVPVMKCHLQCGITASLKNYVGTAPREAYTLPGIFSNHTLHSEHSAGGRIDPFIVDLAAFHPPDYCVVDGLRGLQSQEHSNGRPDQMVQSNLVLAGEDPVAADSLVAQLLGFNTHDMEFLHMAARRGMGTMDAARIDVRGDDADRHMRRWERPHHWYGRCNREWLIQDASGRWTRTEARFDTLDLVESTGRKPAPGTVYTAAAQFDSPGHARGLLWLGARGEVSVRINGEAVASFTAATSYRVGQYQFPISARPGANRIEVTVAPLGGRALLSLLVTGRSNDGGTLAGLRWSTPSAA